MDISGLTMDFGTLKRDFSELKRDISDDNNGVRNIVYGKTDYMYGYTSWGVRICSPSLFRGSVEIQVRVRLSVYFDTVASLECLTGLQMLHPVFIFEFTTIVCTVATSVPRFDADKRGIFAGR